jgi:hypothetical protein
MVSTDNSSIHLRLHIGQKYSENRLPNLPIIKESQIQIHVYLFISAFILSAGVTHGLVLIPKYTHIQIIVKNNFRGGGG